MRLFLLFFLLYCWSLSSQTYTLTSAKAVPSAEGYGRNVTGARAGASNRVVFVTNTNNSGAGSLRSAIDNAQEGDYIVATVGGLITLTSAIQVDVSNITIDLSTAPGDGLTIRRANTTDDHAGIRVSGANNVIIIGLRIRLGPTTYDGVGASLGDALTVLGVNGLYVDRYSFSWTTDETVNIWNSSQNVTMQRGIIGEPLAYADNDPSPAITSARAFLTGNGSQNITMYKTLIVSSQQRNPLLGGTPPPASGGNHEVVDLIVSGMGAFGFEMTTALDVNAINIMMVNRQGFSTRPDIVSTSNSSNIYFPNLYGDLDFGDSPWENISDNGITMSVVDSTQQKLTSPNSGFPLAGAALKTEAELIATIEEMGYPKVDAVDSRYKGYIYGNTTGSFLSNNTFSESNYPTYSSGTANLDSDGDGLWDEFETVNPGVNPFDQPATLTLISGEVVDQTSITPSDRYFAIEVQQIADRGGFGNETPTGGGGGGSSTPDGTKNGTSAMLIAH